MAAAAESTAFLDLVTAAFPLVACAVGAPVLSGAGAGAGGAGAAVGLECVGAGVGCGDGACVTAVASAAPTLTVVAPPKAAPARLSKPGS